MAKVNPAWLISNNPGDLKAQIRHAVQFGFHPVSQDSTTAHLTRKKKFSCLFATLSFLCFGVGFLIYLFYYMAKRDDEIYLDLATQPKGEALKAYVAQDLEKKRRNMMILVGFLIFIFVVLPVLSMIGEAMNDPEVTPTMTTSTQVVFDVPSLVVIEDIDGVKVVLGTPIQDMEPTQQQIEMGTGGWGKTWEKNGVDLYVTYNERTRKIVDFFVSGVDPSGVTSDKALLLAVSGTKEGDSRYRLEFVAAKNTPGKYTGIKITPMGR